MVYNEELDLLVNLRDKVASILAFVSTREKILSRQEGEICVIVPSSLDERGEYSIRLNSYLVESSGLPNEWTGKTLKIALQRALQGVQYWSQFERDAVPYDLQTD